MTDSPSALLLLRLQSTGSNTNLWGVYLNTALQTIEQASKGYQTLAVTGDATITWTNYTTGNVGQCAHLELTGTLSASATLTFPTYQNRLAVDNNAGQTVTIKCFGGTGVAIPNGRRAVIKCDGTDYEEDGGNYGGNSVLANGSDLPNYTALQAYVTAALAAISAGTSGGFRSLFTYTATGGETSKSGVDNNGNTLAYTVGQEEVYLNGVKLIGVGIDYTASTGTSIAGLSALSAGDVLVVLAWASFAVANTYTQAQVDVLLAAIFTSIHTWSAAQTFSALLTAASLTATGVVTLGSTSNGTTIKGADSLADVRTDATSGMWRTGRGLWITNGRLGSPGSGFYVDFASSNARYNIFTTGAHNFLTNDGATQQFSILHTASSNRWPTVTGSNGGNPAISASAGELAVGTNAWTFGIANSVSPTSPNRTLTITIGGTTYYIAAKTTND